MEMTDRDYLSQISSPYYVGGVFYWHHLAPLRNEHEIIACNPLESGGRRFCKVKLPDPLSLCDNDHQCRWWLGGVRDNHQCWLGGVRNSHLYFGATLDYGKEVRVWVYEESSRIDIGGGDKVEPCKWKLEHTLRLEKVLEEHRKEFLLTQKEALTEFNYAKFVFKGFHPYVRGIMFFTFQDKLMSYNFENERLVVHFSESLPQSHEQMNFIPFDWVPSGYDLFSQGAKKN